MSAALAAPTYKRSGQLPLWWSDGSGGSGLPAYRSGYYAAPNTTLPDPASLDDLWRNGGGTYLFVNRVPGDDATFVDNLRELLRRIGPGGEVRMLWISDPQPAWQDWEVQYARATWSGSGQAIAWTLESQLLFALGAYTVSIDGQTALTQASPDAYPGWGVAAGGAGLRFSGPAMGYDAQPGSTWLPLSGAALGCWKGAYTLKGGGDDNLALLGVQLRYASVDADGNVIALPMPVLRQGADPVSLDLAYDPLNPDVRDRTQAEFLPPSGQNSGPPLAATLITPLGYGTTLSPSRAPTAGRGARLVFNASPQLLEGEQIGAPYQDYYLAPDGPFVLSAATGVSTDLVTAGNGLGKLVLGTSGLEYVELPLDGSALAFFDSGHDAFAPGALTTAPPPAAMQGAEADGEPTPLSNLATTSYLTFLPKPAQTPQAQAGFAYFAQPQQAPLYAPGGKLGGDFLDFVPLQAGTVGAGTTAPEPGIPEAAGPATFPVGVYAALPSTLAWAARKVEDAALAPARRAAISNAGQSRQAAEAPTRAVTPQGLIGDLSGGEWSRLQIANLPHTEHPELLLTRLRGDSAPHPLLGLLQSNQLFAVVANPGVFMEQASVRYQVTATVIAILLQKEEITPDEAKQLGDWFNPGQVLETEQALLDVIKQHGGMRQEAVDALLREAGVFKADLQGWTFQLSPRSWRPGPDNPTIMLAKYCSRSLVALVADAASWAWKEAAVRSGEKLSDTQKLILDIFAAARDAPTDSPEHRFYAEVVDNAAWNGTLFLNAPVSLADFPDELQFVLAGLDAERFYAHHVGFSLTPFAVTTPEGGGTKQIEPKRTAAFGLIRYSDPEDLVHGVDTQGFAFKTLSLSARFANAALADFAAQVELLATRLFGDTVAKLDPSRGNNLVLDGSFQRQNGAPTYAFSLRGSNVFRLARSALLSVEVLGVQLQTSSGTKEAATVRTDFVLTGNLRFRQDYPFDLFSYGAVSTAPEGQPLSDGWLRFGNLTVSMSFPLGDTSDQEFTLNEGRIGFDAGASVTRPGSLVRGFPLRLTGMVAGPVPNDPATKGTRPEDLGFTSVSAPIEQALLNAPWYGLVFTLDLGTVGALAGSVGMNVELLAAWAPGGRDEDQPVFLGLKLPAGPSWPLQGVLRLTFRSFQFVVVENDDKTRSYMLRMHRFALSLLGWSFPPGTTDVLLFGDPDGSDATALGWYAAYAKDDKTAKAPSALAALRAAPPADRAQQRRLAAGRRNPPPTAGV